MFPYFFIRAWIAFMLMGVGLAQAQSVKPVSSVDASGTIASTGVYQSLFATDFNRSGCTIQNNGTHAMSVRFAGVTVWSLPAGQAISCNNGAIVVDDKVEITGTSGDAFTASFQ